MILSEKKPAAEFDAIAQPVLNTHTSILYAHNMEGYTSNCGKWTHGLRTERGKREIINFLNQSLHWQYNEHVLSQNIPSREKIKDC